jgi:hypothetical protein
LRTRQASDSPPGSPALPPPDFSRSCHRRLAAGDLARFLREGPTVNNDGIRKHRDGAANGWRH